MAMACGSRAMSCALMAVNFTEIKSKGQKELRIIDTLEPVLASHKLLVHEAVIEADYRTAVTLDGTVDVSVSGFHQLTRITKERGSLGHDDRLDALAIGVAYFTEAWTLRSSPRVRRSYASSTPWSLSWRPTSCWYTRLSCMSPAGMDCTLQNE